jgi:hypothetical protein
VLGRNGRDYVRRNYRWDVILSKYERMFARLRQGAQRRSKSLGFAIRD